MRERRGGQSRDDNDFFFVGFVTSRPVFDLSPLHPGVQCAKLKVTP